ncbi:hypothetical protein GH733_013814 [Mirounga leonina]|nr:hypothetical protein GH733_013814 [Mirounga leonina]
MPMVHSVPRNMTSFRRAFLDKNFCAPQTRTQKLIELDDECKLSTFYEKCMATEVVAATLGEEWKGYLMVMHALSMFSHSLGIKLQKMYMVDSGTCTGRGVRISMVEPECGPQHWIWIQVLPRVAGSTTEEFERQHPEVVESSLVMQQSVVRLERQITQTEEDLYKQRLHTSCNSHIKSKQSTSLGKAGSSKLPEELHIFAVATSPQFCHSLFLWGISPTAVEFLAGGVRIMIQRESLEKRLQKILAAALRFAHTGVTLLGTEGECSEVSLSYGCMDLSPRVQGWPQEQPPKSYDITENPSDLSCKRNAHSSVVSLLSA